MPIVLMNALIIMVIVTVITIVLEVSVRNATSYLDKKKNKKLTIKWLRKLQVSILCTGLLSILIVSALQWRQVDTEQIPITDFSEPLTHNEIVTLEKEITKAEATVDPIQIKQVEADSAEAYNKFLKELNK